MGVLAALLVVRPAAGQAYGMASGTYTGDGTDDRAITGVGFQPDVVIVKRYPNVKGELRTSTMVGDASKQMQSTSSLAANRIQ